ncbi:MAG: adenosylcobinamide-GDP ribazoletransferase [Thermodesulfobacteriota bacterium]
MSLNQSASKALFLAAVHPLASLLAALRFLTVIPISWKGEADGDYFQASLVWFPVVGLLLGGMTAGFAALLGQIFPSSVTAVLAIFFLGALTGFLHLDGVADSGDGLLSSRSTEKSLAIMRDSRIGAMGVIALIFVLLLKAVALSAMDERQLITLFFMPVVGRTGIVLMMAVLPYARKEGGLGTLFYSPLSRWVGLAALVFLGGLSLLFSFSLMVTALCALFVCVTLFSFWCHQKIGGATGDTLGACCELCEAVFALAMTWNMVG